jgi:hypothetical protein
LLSTSKTPPWAVGGQNLDAKPHHLGSRAAGRPLGGRVPDAYALGFGLGDDSVDVLKEFADA